MSAENGWLARDRMLRKINFFKVLWLDLKQICKELRSDFWNATGRCVVCGTKCTNTIGVSKTHVCSVECLGG